MTQPPYSISNSLKRLNSLLHDCLFVDLSNKGLPALADLERTSIVGALKDGKADVHVLVRFGVSVIQLLRKGINHKRSILRD